MAGTKMANTLNMHSMSLLLGGFLMIMDTHTTTPNLLKMIMMTQRTMATSKLMLNRVIMLGRGHQTGIWFMYRVNTCIYKVFQILWFVLKGLYK